MFCQSQKLLGPNTHIWMINNDYIQWSLVWIKNKIWSKMTGKENTEHIIVLFIVLFFSVWFEFWWKCVYHCVVAPKSCSSAINTQDKPWDDQWKLSCRFSWFLGAISTWHNFELLHLPYLRESIQIFMLQNHIIQAILV